MADHQVEDSQLLKAASLELESYLRSKVLFWRIGGLSLPLTPGNLLLAMKRDQGFSPGMHIEIHDNLERIINQTRGNWQQKIHEEIAARITQWENLLKDFEEDAFFPAQYTAHVRTRAILTLCFAESTFPDQPLENRLQFLDDRLRLLVRPGAFIWETLLEREFPVQEYWYLYANLKG